MKEGHFLLYPFVILQTESSLSFWWSALDFAWLPSYQSSALGFSWTHAKSCADKSSKNDFCKAQTPEKVKHKVQQEGSFFIFLFFHSFFFNRSNTSVLFTHCKPTPASCASHVCCACKSDDLDSVARPERTILRHRENLCSWFSFNCVEVGAFIAL